MSDVKKILLVADYGRDDLAFQEVRQRLYDLAQDAGIHIHVDIVSVEAFNTAQTAAVVAEAAESGQYDMVYHNTAPRRDKDHERAKNDGEGLAYAEVQNERGQLVQIIGVYAGNAHSVNTFSLLPEDSEIRQVNCDTDGSQFRSRDVFPQEVIAALTGDIRLGSELHPPGPEDDALVEATRRTADRLLSRHQDDNVSYHGDAARGYITLIAPRSHIREQSLRIATCDEEAQEHAVEVDALPLKCTKNAWIEAGFAAVQLALNSRHRAWRRTIVALPGKEDTLESVDTLYDATLDNGANIVTSDLRTLAFAKNRLAPVAVKAYGKEGRSIAFDEGHIVISGEARDVPAAELERATELPKDIVPAYVDGYGNIKLAIAHGALLNRLGVTGIAGEHCIAGVDFGGHHLDAHVATGGSFSVPNGDAALSRGSSGWNGDEDRFAEIFLRGGNAAKSLGDPQPGDAIRIGRKSVQPAQPGGVIVNASAPEGAFTIQPHAGARNRGGVAL